MGKLLSFAIPCYNSAEYMEHCINTVLAGGDEVEVIIVDDGSTKDNTYEIAKRYETVSYTHLTLPTNSLV